MSAVLLACLAVASPSAAARRLIEVTPVAARARLLAPFSDEARSDWHYTPRRRAGIAWRDMNDAQREAATALLRTAVTDPGLEKVRAVMALEIPLGEIEGSGRFRDPENYAFAYGDIVTKHAAEVSLPEAAGVRLVDLPAAERAALLELVAVFAEHLRPELADARLRRVRAESAESLRFGWAGSLEPGRPHYFRIQGAAFVIELDNSGGNHIHSVWRDRDGDWGRDVLGEHYRRDHSKR